MEEIDTLVTGMEMKDDVVVILDQAVLPLISMMGAGKGHPQAQAAALLATMMEQRPGLSDFIRNKGGLEAAAHLLKTGAHLCGPLAPGAASAGPSPQCVQLYVCCTVRVCTVQ